MKQAYFFVIISLLITTTWAQKNPELDLAKSRVSQEECTRIAQWGLLKGHESLQIECGLDNLQFKADTKLQRSDKHIRLGNYNLLHPGTDKTLFKDMKLTAELIDQEFDVMAAVELVDVVATPRMNNTSLRPLMEKMFAPVKATQDRIKLKNEQIKKLSKIKKNLGRLTTLKKELAQLKKDLDKHQQNFQKTARFYRLPGYLYILEELRKIDASWSLVVSPHGDAAVEGNPQELVGFYYRASRVALESNVHCSKRFNNKSSACYPNFYQDYMGTNLATIFSRRPFLATFKDSESSFSMLASHVIFVPPTKKEDIDNMLQKAFGVQSIKELPAGINSQNFARFAEVLVSLQMADKLKREGVPRLIYTGDLNLESKNPFWETVFKKVPGYKILIDAETSLSETRFVQGRESNGVSSNYDHFILSQEDMDFCQNASVVNFINNDFSKKIKDKYLIRSEAPMAPYLKLATAQDIIHARTAEMASILDNFNVIIGTNTVTTDSKKTVEDLKKFTERVFDSQFVDKTYYKMFSQVMSDHLPIKLECRF